MEFLSTIWDTIYVAEQYNNRVTRWLKGEKKGSLIVGGRNQLNRPIGLKFDRHGNLYVVDCDNHRVQRFSIASNLFQRKEETKDNSCVVS